MPSTGTRRWVVERTSGWLGRFGRLGWDYERLAETLAGWHWLAILTLLLAQTGFSSASHALLKPRHSVKRYQRNRKILYI